MKERIIPVLAFVGIVVVGVVVKILKILKYSERLEFTIQYSNTFIEMCNEFNSKKVLNMEKYNECIMKAEKMQIELGHHGIANNFYDGSLKSYISNYQVLINALPVIRDISFKYNEFPYISQERFNSYVLFLDDAFKKHISYLSDIGNKIKKEIFNPFSNFGEGFRFFIYFPFLILEWLGLISHESRIKILRNALFEFISHFFILLGFLSTVITIITGWKAFINFINNIIGK